MTILWTGLVVMVLLVLATFFLSRWLHRMGPDQIGLVTRRIGFLGSTGPQVRTLMPGTVTFVPAPFFTVLRVNRTRVPNGTLGLVIAKSGAIRPGQEPLARYVECDHFQDGEGFLSNGGQQGVQLEVLSGGSYAINPLLFEVHTVISGSSIVSADQLRTTAVTTGSVGVVIAMAGGPSEAPVAPVIAGHQCFQIPWVFLGNGGRRGVQQEVLSEGAYLINPCFARVVRVPTRHLIVEWRRKDGEPDGYDRALEPVTLTIEGHRAQVEISQVFRIPPETAPRIVAEFAGPDAGDDSLGDPIARFVEYVLGSAVAAYFSALAPQSRLIDVLGGAGEIRAGLEETIRSSLSAWEVEAGPTSIGEFRLENPELDDVRRIVASQREQLRSLDWSAQNARVDELFAEQENRVRRAKHDVEVQVLREQIVLLGTDQVALERVLAVMAEMKVPQFLAGDGDLTGLVDVLPLPVVRELVERTRTNAPDS